jgi:N-acetylneuraminic acid mutarotase
MNNRGWFIVLLAWVLGVTLRAQEDSIGFLKHKLEGTLINRPTAIQWGADGRLYVLELGGYLKILTIVRVEAGVYNVLRAEVLDTIALTPNHEPNGAPSPVKGRHATGLLVTGTAEAPVMYVSHSDQRYLYFDNNINPKNDAFTDTNSGIVTRLAWDGSTWQRQDLVRGLPRSLTDHTINALALDEATNTLYLSVAGMTNGGAPVNAYFTPETALSASILAFDLDALNGLPLPYDLPTLDDPDRAGDPDTNDPFGGNDGKNQAYLPPNAPIRLFAVGFRNAYDIQWANGRLYATENGANKGWGGVPIDCTDAHSSEGDVSQTDKFFLVQEGFYGGHPNPTRGRGSEALALTPDERQCTRLSAEEAGALVVFPDGTNAQGFVQYTASSFNGALRGDFLVANWFGDGVTRLHMSDNGEQVLALESLFDNVAELTLDVTAQGDDGLYPGTVWVSAFAEGGAIYAFEPLDYDGARALLGRVGDSDGDGYSDEDEIFNRTNPNSPASVPPDADNDGISDLLDDDDDNDGILDVDDVFPRDPHNGTQTPLPLRYTWDSGNPGTGILGLGFTGLMSDGGLNYQSLYDAQNIIAGGAQGWLTIKSVSSGDAIGNKPQENAFHVGVTPEGDFMARTRMIAPFFDGKTPQLYQAQGITLGTGRQDSFIKLTRHPNGYEVLYTQEGGFTNAIYPAPDLADTPYIDVGFIVSSSAGVRPFVQTPAGDYLLGDWLRPVWFDGLTTYAVGMISTSFGASPFSATWDWFEVLPLPSLPTAVLEPNTTFSTVPSATPALPKDEGRTLPIADCGTMRTVTPSPVPRYESMGVVLGGKLYMLGGFTGNNLTAIDDFSVYDPASDTWTTLQRLPAPITHIGVAGDEATATIWLVGGFVGNHPGTATSDVWFYNTREQGWRRAPSLPVPLASAQVGLIGRTLYALGGLIDRNAGSEFVYSLALDDIAAGWQSEPMGVQARNHAATALLDGKIVVVGGQYRHDNNLQELKLVEAYDPISKTWTRLADFPYSISHNEASVSVYNGEIIVAGGRSYERGIEATQEIWAYNPQRDAWRLYGYLPEGRIGGVFLPINGAFIFGVGGYTATNVLADVWLGRPNANCQNAQAYIQIAPPLSDHASTFNYGSFVILNTSQGGQRIEQVTFDLSTALLEDAVFDVDGTAGDVVAKPFTVDVDPSTGILSHEVTLKTLTINFSTFDAGKRLLFSIDVDPNSIAGTNAPGPGSSGGVDGGELVNTTVTVRFNDGSVQTTTLYLTPNTNHASQNFSDSTLVSPQVAIEGDVVEVSAGKLRLNAREVEVVVIGESNANIALMVAEGEWFSETPAEGSHRFQSLDLNATREYRVTLDADGKYRLPVTAREGVVTVITAVTYDERGGFSSFPQVWYLE